MAEAVMQAMKMARDMARHVWRRLAWLLSGLCCVVLAGCNNNPLPDGAAASNTLYSAVSGSSPRHLDPTASYWTNEAAYTYQIYEPPYGYHYLKRPFELVPKSAMAVAPPRYIDKHGQPLPSCSIHGPHSLIFALPKPALDRILILRPAVEADEVAQRGKAHENGDTDQDAEQGHANGQDETGGLCGHDGTSARRFHAAMAAAASNFGPEQKFVSHAT